MKIPLFILSILAFTVPLRADNVLQNGDFSDGSSHWHGNGKTPNEYAQDNPSAGSDPFVSKGLIVELKPNSWTKVFQDFHGDQGTHYQLIVTYKVSPDTTLSSRAEDYTNIQALIRFEGYESWSALNIEPGRFWIGVVDLDDNKGYHEDFAPKPGMSENQSFTDPGLPMSPSSEKVVTVAFPPGKGTVVILSISVTSS